MRDVFIVLGAGIIVVAIGIAVLAPEDKSMQDPVAGTVPATRTSVSAQELAHGERSTVVRRTNYLINSTSELSEVWNMIETDAQQPEVDFTRNSVVAVFAGKKPTAGHDIEVTKVEDGIVRKVFLKLTSPGVSCLLAQSLTQPYQIIEIPKTSLAYAHEDTAITESCLR